MSLSFKCSNCGQDIVVQYVKKGGDVLCRSCNSPQKVPDTAVDIDGMPLTRPDSSSTGTIANRASAENVLQIDPSKMLNLDGISKFLIFIFFGVVIMMTIALMSNYLQYDLIQRFQRGEYVSAAEAEANDARQETMLYVIYIVSGTCAALFIIWLYRAHKNLRRANVPDLKYGSGWAIGGFFVPILNLVRPYQIMSEIWRGSMLLLDPKNDLTIFEYDAHVTIKIWWGFLISASILSRIISKVLFKDETVEGILKLTMYFMIQDILLIIAAICAIIMIKKTTSLQKEIRENNKLTSTGIISYNQ